MAIGVKRRRTTFEELYGIHAPDALRLARLLVGETATSEDLVQEAFVRVLGKFADLRHPTAFRSYLMRAVVNLAKNQSIRRSVERRHAHVLQPTAEPRADMLERNDDLFDALLELPARQRAALVLRYCEDLSEQDTADLLQTSVKAVKSLVTRGLSALRQREGEFR